MSYETNFADAYVRPRRLHRSSAVEGAKPADLPVDQVTKYEMLDQPATPPKRLGLTIPKACSPPLTN